VEFITTFEGLAQADALVNAVIDGNSVILQLGGNVAGDFNKRLAVIDGSLNGNTGVVLQLNQDVGDNANQGNIVNAALSDVADIAGPGIEGIVAVSEAFVDQRTSNHAVFMNTQFPGGFPIPPLEVNYPGPLARGNFHVRAELTGSVNLNIGDIVQLNQNAGVNTNQHNVVSAAIGLSAGLALAEGALGQENSGNHTQDFNTYKSDLIQNSVNGNTGAVMVNQNVGHNNNQAAIINIAATTAATNLVPNGNGG
jgi:hypothetical protein